MAKVHKQYENNVSKHFTVQNSFEAVLCPLCGVKKNTLELFKKDSMRVVRCECNFIYNSNQPTKKTLDSFYSSSKAMSNWVKIKKTDHEETRQIEKFGRTIEQLKAKKINSLLDLGCGNGKFLSMLRKALPKARLVGVDQNVASASMAASSFASIVNEDFYSFLDSRGDYFEAISLWGVLEHVKDPIGLLKKIKLRLAGPKILIICVPNVESEVVERLWSECFTFCPQHLWYFSKSTLERMLHLSGFVMDSSFTIEPENLPIQKKKIGVSPYEALPEWAHDKFLSQSVLESVESRVLYHSKGYKIIAWSSVR